MSITLESVLNDALKLPPEERALLADRLHESLSAFSDPEIEKAWVEEIERRIDEMDRGEVKGLSGEEILRKLSRGECP